MKRMVKDTFEDVFGMANLIPRKTGLKAHLWSNHAGAIRQNKDHAPRMKIEMRSEGDWESVSIEPTPKVLDRSPDPKQASKRAFKEAREYIGKNYDLFLKHYNDVDDEFDDEDLMNALRARGVYK